MVVNKPPESVLLLLLSFIIYGNDYWCVFSQSAKLSDKSTASHNNIPESKLAFLHRLSIVNSSFSNLQLAPFYPDSIVATSYYPSASSSSSSLARPLITSASIRNQISDDEKSSSSSLIDSLVFYNEPSLTSGSSLIKALLCDKTLAIIEYVNKSRIKKCELFDLEKRLEEANKSIYDRKLRVEKVDFHQLQEVINRCQELERFTLANNGHVDDVSMYNGTYSTSETMVAFWRGVVPGTKWCGLGDIAKNYFDIGRLWHVDVCCRAHDHCPYRMKALRYGYGLLNLSFYTRSHCMCDDAFWQCLKKSNSNIGNTLGNIYFNVVQVHCFKEDEASECLNEPNSAVSCNNQLSNRKMIFAPPKSFP